MKKLNKWDVWSIKLATAAFILFLITVWPVAMTWVNGVHWGWFLGITILAGLKPFSKWLKA